MREKLAFVERRAVWLRVAACVCLLGLALYCLLIDEYQAAVLVLTGLAVIAWPRRRRQI